jgi:hypothetical protein
MEIIKKAGKHTVRKVTRMMMAIPIGKSANILVLKHVTARHAIKGGAKRAMSENESKGE